MLKMTAVQAAHGKSEALRGIDVSVEPYEVACLIGRNGGVGKSSTMKAIVRDQITVTGGEVVFDGASLAGLRPHDIVRRGVGYVPEDRRVFASLSVLENLRVARPVMATGRRMWSLDQVFQLFPQLYDYCHRTAGVMSGGEQQMLSIARSLLTQPRLLLLDEPHEGLAPKVAEEVVDAIGALKRDGAHYILNGEKTSISANQISAGTVLFAGSGRPEDRALGDFRAFGANGSSGHQHVQVLEHGTEFDRSRVDLVRQRAHSGRIPSGR
jgi:branched-chain amino acid transport system ATP-binding protein